MSNQDEAPSLTGWSTVSFASRNICWKLQFNWAEICSIQSANLQGHFEMSWTPLHCKKRITFNNCTISFHLTQLATSHEHCIPCTERFFEVEMWKWVWRLKRCEHGLIFILFSHLNLCMWCVNEHKQTFVCVNGMSA